MHRDYERKNQKNNPRAPAIDMKKRLTADEFKRFNEGLLGWIRFTELQYRHEKIAEAYEETFQWIFKPQPEDHWSNFVDWTQSDTEPLYWITGKPAAGKSTLMKFIYLHLHTKELLELWTRGKKLVKSAFYFWNSGTELQMSEEGMARTLLHGALQEAPELWAVAFPQKMEEFVLFGDPWRRRITWEEITYAFRRLVEGAGKNYNLFFFIDGLDEHNGDHHKLITMIQGFLSPFVKTLVSSRPWIVFEDGFHQRPSLRLEDITYQDIKHYVSSRLHKNLGFEQLQIVDPQYAAELVTNVVKKASGVFLWVRLVINSLLEGLSEGERLEELQKRLDNLPPDLEHLFWNILSSLDEQHLKRASEFFQLYRESLRPLTLLMLSYADETDPDIASKIPFGISSLAQLNARAHIMRRRLNACSKGLLEAKSVRSVPLVHTEVGYLHRTVKDYVERNEVWTKILDLTDSNFNLYFRLCNERIIRLRISNPVFFKWENSGIEFWSTVTDAIRYALLADPEDLEGLQTRALKALDVAAAHLANIREGTDSTYTEVMAREFGVQSMPWTGSRTGCFLNKTFLHLAIQARLVNYIRNAIADSASVDQAELSQGLLVATLQHQLDIGVYGSSRKLSLYRTAGPPDLLTLLLSHGADPNLPISNALKHVTGRAGSFSPWQAFLLTLKLNPPLTLRLPWYKSRELRKSKPKPNNSKFQDFEPADSEPDFDDEDDEYSFGGYYRYLGHPPIAASIASTAVSRTTSRTTVTESSLHENMVESHPEDYLDQRNHDSGELVVMAKLFLDYGADPSLVNRDRHGEEIWILAKKKLSERRFGGIRRISAVFGFGKG